MSIFAFMSTMNKHRKVVVAVLLAVPAILLYVLSSLYAVLGYIILLGLLEIASYYLLRALRKRSPLFIMPPDEEPRLSKEGLAKFFRQGYDAELGWVRKPGTGKTEHSKVGETSYHINEHGARSNPHHEKLPVMITCHGDSFTFCRQVNDTETWPWHLSELTTSNVLNYGVGNYGLDQALLRMKREFPRKKSPVVIMGVVPSTIVRILAVWKHFHEFGNTFGFKPVFTLQKGVLRLHKNPIDTEHKFSRYQDYLPAIRRLDYFYKAKFRQEMFEFPYLISILSRPMRNIPLIAVFSLSSLRKKDVFPASSPKTQSRVMTVLGAANLFLFTPMKVTLFRHNEYAVRLLKALVEEFYEYARSQGAEPVFLWMPQKDDVLFMKRRGVYYQQFIRDVQKIVKTIDLTPDFLACPSLGTLFSEDNADGGHFSAEGNKVVAQIIYRHLKEWNLTTSQQEGVIPQHQ